MQRRVSTADRTAPVDRVSISFEHNFATTAATARGRLGAWTTRLHRETRVFWARLAMVHGTEAGEVLRRMADELARDEWLGGRPLKPDAQPQPLGNASDTQIRPIQAGR